jgi:hypothetical protein
MANSTVTALTAASTLTGAELIYGVQSAADRKVTVDQVKTYTNTGPFGTYIVGNWYVPQNTGLIAAGGAGGTGSIRLRLVYIPIQVTIDTLGVRINIAGAAGNMQAAIYANNTATMRPTGNALVSTASMSTAATAAVNAAASLQLGPGWYWTATNCDNATAAAAGENSGTWSQSSTVGSTTQQNTLGGSSGFGGLSVAQTFGTWPDLTAASFADVTSAATIPVLTFKVASVP